MAVENNNQDDVAEIERDVERTQDEIGNTVQELEEKMSPRKFAQSLFSDDNADMANDAWQVVRESPIQVAMIAAGTAWLFATSNAPMISRLREQVKSRIQGVIGSDGGTSEQRLRPRSEEPAPIGPPPETGSQFDRRAGEAL